MTKNSLNLTSIVMLAHGFRVENGLLGISMFDIFDYCSAVFIGDQGNCINSGISHFNFRI